MTDDDRKRLRRLQDRWLALPAVAYNIRTFGEDVRISGMPNAPTFRDVKEMILPEYEQHFREYFSDRGGSDR